MMIDATDVLSALPAAVYTTDAQGRIVSFNTAAAAMWGREPQLGETWCGSWRLYWPDGRPMAHEECPMAVTLREGREVRDVSAILERPDGQRIPFRPFPTLLRDKSGAIVGALNMLVDISAQTEQDITSARLAAIVEGSDDAILSKTLEGIITSWNTGAERIFGYTADEMVGQSILRLIPPDLRSEEDDILSRLKRGERIDHFDTVRVTKDGRRIHLSITVSPVRDGAGNIVGASKVARDVTERKRAEEMQRLLFNELNHRVKNMLASIQAIASQSLRSAAGPDQFVTSFNGRIRAMARAHDLLVQGRLEGADMFGLVRDQVVLGVPDSRNVTFSGPHVVVDDRAAVQLALVLHELATNARKYGALARPEGQLSISWRLETAPERALLLQWSESGVRGLSAPTRRGFGTRLIERSLDSNGGAAAVRYEADGLKCDIRLPLPETPSGAMRANAHAQVREAQAREQEATAQPPPGLLRGRRVLVVEDEPLVAMEVEAELEALGCTVVGPVGAIAAARRLIEQGGFDLVVLDANLAGEPVGELASALTRKAIPFLFATGYGREALPPGFEHAPVLTKPYSDQELRDGLTRLLGGVHDSVVAFRPRG